MSSTFIGPDPPLSAAATSAGAPDPFSTSLPTSLSVYRAARALLGDDHSLDGADLDDGGERWNNATLRPHLSKALRDLHAYCTAQAIPWTRKTQFVHWGPYTKNLPPQLYGLIDMAIPIDIGSRPVVPVNKIKISSIALSTGPAGATEGVAKITPEVVPHPFRTGYPVTISGVRGFPSLINDLWMVVNDEPEDGSITDAPSHFFINGCPARPSQSIAPDSYYAKAYAYWSQDRFIKVDQKDEETMRAYAMRVPAPQPYGWHWRNSTLELTPTNVEVQLAITYYCSSTLPTSIYENIGIENSTDYLASITAAGAMGPISPSLAGDHMAQAMESLKLLRNPQVRQKQMLPIDRPSQYPARRHKF